MDFTEHRQNHIANHEAFYRDPSSEYIEPFRIYGPLYYVGDRDVCVHLIDTGDGLLLIDAGYPHAVHMLVDSIWRLGFDPRDVKVILHTHGHFDHFGASNEFRALYGCDLAISRTDAEFLRNQPETGLLDWASSVTPMAYVPPEFQILLDDGQDFTLGNTTIHCIQVPGHTPGVMAYFFDVTENGKTLRAGLLGGIGLASVGLPMLDHFGLPHTLQTDMLRTVDALHAQHVDIHLGNHADNNHTIEKRQRQLAEGGNPFVDPAAWDAFLNDLHARLLKIIERDQPEVAAQLRKDGKL